MNNPFAKNVKKPNENNAKKKKPNLSINNRYATDLSLDSSSSNPENKPKYKVPAKIPPKKETKPVEIKEEDNTHKDPVNALFEDNKTAEDNVDDIFNQVNKEEPKIEEKKEKAIEEVNTNTEVVIDNSKNGNEENNVIDNNEEQIEHIKEEENNNNQIASVSPNDSKEAKSVINEEEPEVNELNEVKDANGHEEQNSNTNQVISNIREEENKEEIENHFIVDKSNDDEIIQLKKEIMSLKNQLHLAKVKESSFEAECNQYKNQIKSQSEIISQYKLKEINEGKYKTEIEILKSTISNKDTEIDALKKENSTLSQHLQSLSSFIKEYIEQRENNKENEEEEQPEDDQPNEHIEIPKQSDPAVHEVKETNVVIEQDKEVIEPKQEEVKQEPVIENPPVIQKEVPKPKFKPKERTVVNPPKTSLDDFLSNVESVDNIFSKDDKEPLSKSLFD